MSWLDREDWKIVNKYKDWVSKEEIEEDTELKDLIMFICNTLHFQYENIVNLYVENDEGEFSIEFKDEFCKSIVIG